jgi:hypothetical protein
MTIFSWLLSWAATLTLTPETVGAIHHVICVWNQVD